MNVFFKVGTTDITSYMDYQNYSMNKETLYEPWTDANGVEHRAAYRTKITGEFKVGFKKKTDLDAFITLLASQINSDGYYTVTGYINNTGTDITFFAFLETKAESKWDFVNSRVWHELTVTVTER